MTSPDPTLSQEGKLRALLSSIDPSRPRIVVRFIDETRIVSEGESGYTVGPVSSVTLTSFQDGAAQQTTFEGLDIARARQIIASFPLDVLYRCDNIT